MHGSDLGKKYGNFMLITYNVFQASVAKLFETHDLRKGKLTTMLIEK